MIDFELCEASFFPMLTQGCSQSHCKDTDQLIAMLCGMKQLVEGKAGGQLSFDDYVRKGKCFFRLFCGKIYFG